MLRRTIAIVSAIILTLALSGCGRQRSDPPDPPTPPATVYATTPEVGSNTVPVPVLPNPSQEAESSSDTGNSPTPLAFSYPLQTFVFTETSSMGYTTEFTLNIGGWIRAIDTEAVASAWRSVGGRNELPPVYNGVVCVVSGNTGGFEPRYAVLAVGNLSIANITEGWDRENWSTNIRLEPRVGGRDYVLAREGIGGVHIAYGREFWYDSFSNNWAAQRMGLTGGGDIILHGNRWDNMPIVIGASNVFTPAHPDGNPRLDEFTFTFGTGGDTFRIPKTWGLSAPIPHMELNEELAIRNAQFIYDHIQETYGSTQGLIRVVGDNSRYAIESVRRNARFADGVNVALDVGTVAMNLAVGTMLSGGDFISTALEEVAKIAVSNTLSALGSAGADSLSLGDFLYAQAHFGYHQIHDEGLSPLLRASNTIDSNGGVVPDLETATRFILAYQNIRMGYVSLNMARDYFIYDRLNRTSIDHFNNMGRRVLGSQLSSSINSHIGGDTITGVGLSNATADFFGSLSDYARNASAAHREWAEDIRAFSQQTMSWLSYHVVTVEDI